METVRPPCAALPSGQAAYNLVSGDWSYLVPVVGTALARAALIGVGIAVLGNRAAAVEAFVLMWAVFKKNQEK